ncbi:hypothetical protein EL84_11360 [Paenibacillus sp. VT-400]|uniref:hypothetical protein n=1 Tax=Paenibacillus sp. VT-400 TaxID=1495853 RepID=UPI00064A83CF|nr:hypothetical protein [Paenibacillus sp. VT-400]KLU52976.1 hypothetical protein EL84_11360 [Paenibacillus sp. VT-400]
MNKIELMSFFEESKIEYEVLNGISSSVVKLTGIINIVVYVKESNNLKEPFWGITENVLKNLEEEVLPWYVVFIDTSKNQTFVLTEKMIRSITREKKIYSGDYKIHEIDVSNYKVNLNTILEYLK